MQFKANVILIQILYIFKKIPKGPKWFETGFKHRFQRPVWGPCRSWKRTQKEKRNRMRKNKENTLEQEENGERKSYLLN